MHFSTLYLRLLRASLRSDALAALRPSAMPCGVQPLRPAHPPGGPHLCLLCVVILCQKCKKMKKNLSLSCIYQKKAVPLCRILIFAAMTPKQKTIWKAVLGAIIAALTAVSVALGLQSCNVTRTITNESQYYQRGDTSVVIQTKTIETYDASKRL